MKFLKNKFPKFQGGVALVSVMLLLAILVTLISYMLESQYVLMRQTGMQSSSEEAYLEGSYVESWALSMLIKPSSLEADYASDFLEEPWSEEALDYKTTGMHTKANIIDLQGRFNLNNLANGAGTEWYWVFKSLLNNLELNPNIADVIVDWVDLDNNLININGAEDLAYLSESPSRRAANQYIRSIDELLLVKGITLDDYSILKPHITVIPNSNVKINVNTATLEVMKAILPNGANSGAPELFVNLRSSGFNSISDLNSLNEFAGVGDNLDGLIDVKSNYFQVESDSTIDGVQRKFKYGLKREKVGQTIKLSVIYRKREI